MPEQAEQLRASAQRLRELAGAAYPGPWYFDEDGNLHDGGQDIAAPYKQANGEYIAAMHPGVALALADWLDAEADGLDEDGGTAMQDHSLDLARLVLEAK